MEGPVTLVHLGSQHRANAGLAYAALTGNNADNLLDVGLFVLRHEARAGLAFAAALFAAAAAMSTAFRH